MTIESADKMLRNSEISPTPNRLLVLRAIAEASFPVSLTELDTQLETLDKSSILRTLNLLESHALIHAVEDGRGITKYELCHREGDHHSQDDMHIHFYCNSCKRTFCFTQVAVPPVPVPEGFETLSVNYMLKGLCPDCR